MIYAGRSGHNPLAPGAIGIVPEVEIDQKIFRAVRNYLDSSTVKFVNCYPGNVANATTELMQGINMANNSGADLFFSIHLNKAYSNYNGTIGSEIWLHPAADSATKNKATAILKNLEVLGFKNRGIKYSSDLAELNSTSMQAMIIECFFCEATGDVTLYRRVGPDLIGLAIAQGLLNKPFKIVNELPNKAGQTQHRNVCVYAKGADIDCHIANCLAMYLEDCIVVDHTEYSKGIGKSVYSIGKLTGIECDVAIRGDNRQDTFEKAMARVGFKR